MKILSKSLEKGPDGDAGSLWKASSLLRGGLLGLGGGLRSLLCPLFKGYAPREDKVKGDVGTKHVHKSGDTWLAEQYWTLLHKIPL